MVMSWAIDGRGMVAARMAAGAARRMAAPKTQRAVATVTIATALAMASIDAMGGRSGFFQLVLVLDGAAVLALRIHIAIDQFDDRHRRGVRRAVTGLDDAAIATLA